MSDEEFVVAELDRGEHGALRVARRVYKGKAFTDVRLYYRDDNDELKPTQKGTSIRDHELGQVIQALSRIHRKINSNGKPSERKSAPAQDQQAHAEIDDEGLF